MPNDRIDIWLRLRDAKRFEGDAKRSAGAIRSIGSAAGSKALHGLQTRLQGIHGQLQHVGATAKVAGVATATGLGFGIKQGINFNATMEQNEVAFKNFLGSGKRTKKFLEDLYQTAAKTPFEFPELTAAARKFLAFGFTAKETKSILGTVGDTVAGIGGGSEEIGRMTMALGQMQAKGKVSAEELMQLAELGIPAYDILRKKLGLTRDEVGRIGELGISSDKAIRALTEGMDERFGGAAAAQAKTFAGQMSTFKDNFAKFLGDATKPLFNFIRSDVFPFMNKALVAIQGGLKDFFAAVAPAEPFLKNVILPLLKGFAIGVGMTLLGAFKIAIFAIEIFAKALGWLGNVLEPLAGAFEIVGVALSFFFGGAIIKGVIGIFTGFLKVLKWLATPLAFLGRGFTALGGAMGKMSPVAQFIGKAFLWIVGGPIVALIRGAGKLGFIFKGLSLIGRTLGRAVGWLSSQFGRVTGWIGNVARALGSRLAPIIRFLPAPFRSLGGSATRVFTLVKNGAVSLVTWFAAMPGKMADIFSGLWDGLWNGFKAVVNAIIRAWNGLEFHMGGTDLGPLGSLPEVTIGTPNIPELGFGGRALRGGAAVVGDRGRPELLTMPAGATVEPLPFGGSDGPAIDLSRILVTKVYLDRRQIAEATAEGFEDAEARR